MYVLSFFLKLYSFQYSNEVIIRVSPKGGHPPPHLYSLFCDNNFVRIKIYNIIVLSVKAILIIIHQNLHSDPLLPPFIFLLGETLLLWSTNNLHKSYYDVWTTYVHIHYMKMYILNVMYKLCVSFMYRDDVSDDTTHGELTL